MSDWGPSNGTADGTADDSWGAPSTATTFVDNADNVDSAPGAAPANEPAPVIPVVQKIPQALEGWVQPTPYDYTDNAPSTWEANAQVYEWDGEHGQIGPEHPLLELQLFGEKTTGPSHGVDFSQ